jgi:alpha-amylase
MQATIQALLRKTVAVLPVGQLLQNLHAEKNLGNSRDVLLQGFHWQSHAGARDGSRHRRSWYRIIHENATSIKGAGFTWVWFPPPSDSLVPEGYLPRRWHVFDSAYGTEAELRAAIAALKPVKAMADVVVNHRVGVATSGADFADPSFPDNRAAVTCDDRSGAGNGRPDTGIEVCIAGRELDHTNPDVRAVIKQYLRRLQSIGFRGWRYDLAKGFDGKFVAEYNDATAPDFAVGEYFDGDRQKVTDWIDVTGGKAAAFDFPTRFLLCDACANDDFGRLRSNNAGRVIPGGLIGYWPARAVTFLDNHDTEYRREQEHNHRGDGIRHFPGKTVAMGYSYLLTHPGVPCVFWPHYFDWDDYTRKRIDRLVHFRKAVGLHAQSPIEIVEAKRGLYAAFIGRKVAMKLGSQGWSPGGGWQVVVDGDKFAVWERKR